MDATALAVYAGETKLLIDGLRFIAGVCFAGVLIFAFLYGTVAPRLRRAHRRNREYRAQLRAARMTTRGLKTDLLVGAKRIMDLEAVCTSFEAELRRVDQIRLRTDEHYVRLRRRCDRAEADLASLRAFAATEPARLS